jgi:hypothetical protein
MFSTMCKRKSALAVLVALGQGLPAVLAQKSAYPVNVGALLALTYEGIRLIYLCSHFYSAGMPQGQHFLCQ